MAREILIQKTKTETRVAITVDGKLDDFHLETENQQSILGNIYKGKVETILPSINGAFVNIGQERNGFLYLTDAVNPLVVEELSGARKLLNKILKRQERRVEKKTEGPMQLKEGQEILVQVVKDPFNKKGARLTTHISLAGRFVVYMPYDKHYGISRKIESPEERQRLRDLMKEFTFASSGGFIVRTASKEQNNRELHRDGRFLYLKWQQIMKSAAKNPAPALINKEYDLLWKVVRDNFNNEVDRLIIDSYDDYFKVRKFVRAVIGKEQVSKVHFYKGQEPLFQTKGISGELDTICDAKVNLKSGAYIVVEPTEGLTVVDVNSGKFKTRASPEDAAFMVNMEAAPEIARQLRLRDVGGIIVIDFIDMTKEVHKRKVQQALQDALDRDNAKSEVNRISSLGLIEMTRARTGKTIESITFGPCPYCEGRGKVKVE
jgi:ribonuclease G